MTTSTERFRFAGSCAAKRRFCSAEPSEVIVAELERTERLIDALDKEKKVVLKLIAHHEE